MLSLVQRGYLVTKHPVQRLAPLGPHVHEFGARGELVIEACSVAFPWGDRLRSILLIHVVVHQGTHFIVSLCGSTSDVGTWGHVPAPTPALRLGQGLEGLLGVVFVGVLNGVVIGSCGGATCECLSGWHFLRVLLPEEC